MSTETTSFITNTAKPVLALTFGGGAASNVAYPQNPLFPSFGMQQMQQNPMMNNTYTQAAQPARQQTGSTIYSAPQEPTRPQAYSMSTNTNAPYFINPMMMNYIPQNMQGANNGLTIMSVNPNAPMGVTGMGMPNMQQQNPQMQAGMQGYQYNNMNTANFQGYTQNSYMNPQK